MKVTIPSMRINTKGGKVKAFFNVSLGPLEIDDLKLIEGTNGMFIGFPSRKFTTRDGEEKYADTVKLARDAAGKYTGVAQELYDTIFNAAIAEYEKVAGSTVTADDDDEDGDDLPF